MAAGNVVPSERGRWATVGRVAQVVLTVLVILFMVLAICLAVFLRRGASGEDTLFGHPVFSVASGSMTPTFDTGDVIIDNPVSLTQADHLHKGQIITFQTATSAAGAGSLIITHRIYAVEPGSGTSPVMYRTKGDANNAPDQGLVAPSAIIGLYQGLRVPFGGYVLSTLHQPLTFVILILIPVVYIAFVEIRRRWIALGVQDAERKRARLQQEEEPRA
ncbi:MAG: signal peptidase I [Candidatus Dormibacteria bacterium]|jgi:signal peptidase|nr:signal peptidase I [Candidatus Dormibacteraeota bacterium]